MSYVFSFKWRLVGDGFGRNRILVVCFFWVLGWGFIGYCVFGDIRVFYFRAVVVRWGGVGSSRVER